MFYQYQSMCFFCPLNLVFSGTIIFFICYPFVFGSFKQFYKCFIFLWFGVLTFSIRLIVNLTLPCKTLFTFLVIALKRFLACFFSLLIIPHIILRSSSIFIEQFSSIFSSAISHMLVYPATCY